VFPETGHADRLAGPARALRDAFGGTWFWPILGIIFLPFTTLMYVLLWSPATDVTGWDWLWLGMAVLLDLSHWASAADAGYTNRDRLPAYSSL
jgi:hypothetical protein